MARKFEKGSLERRNKMKMLYQWSEDGEAEQCTLEEIEINTPIEWCYHCGVPIEVGKAIKVTTRTDNYIVHTYCAEKGVIKNKECKSESAAHSFNSENRG